MTSYARQALRFELVRGWLGALMGCVLWLYAPAALALEVPALKDRVTDLAQVLPAARKQAMEQRLASYQQSTGHQFAVLVVPALEGEAIEQFSIRVVEAWQLGRKEQDDGLLVLVAVNDRQARIEVGYGLEGAIPDALAGRVVRSVMTPRFREADYAGGIEQALDFLMKTAEGEASPLPESPQTSDELPSKWVLLLYLSFFVFTFLLSRRRGRGGMLGALVAGHLLGRGSGHGSWGGGGFGGGGRGYSGGGGGFGGGGASGSW